MLWSQSGPCHILVEFLHVVSAGSKPLVKLFSIRKLVSAYNLYGPDYMSRADPVSRAALVRAGRAVM